MRSPIQNEARSRASASLSLVIPPVADRAGFLLNGDLVEVGTAYQIFTKPQNKKTEDYVTGKFG